MLAEPQQGNFVFEDVQTPKGELILVKGIQTNAATSTNDMLENIIENMKYKFPIFEGLTEYNKPKGWDRKIALVGGGPSLKNTIHELKEYRTIMSCGSVHDYLINNNVIPTYAVNCDPSPISANYFTKADPEVKYLIASHADRKLIAALGGKQIILWHCHSEDLQEQIFKIEREENNRDYNAVGGGCTVGLRAISLAMCMGYGNIHFYGFDSCMGDDGEQHHAYDWANPEEENPLIDKVYKIHLGPTTGPENNKHYYVAGYQLAQLENFKDFYASNKDYFIPTFHGGGALADYLELIKRIKPKEQIQ